MIKNFRVIDPRRVYPIYEAKVSVITDTKNSQDNAMEAKKIAAEAMMVVLWNRSRRK